MAETTGPAENVGDRGSGILWGRAALLLGPLAGAAVVGGVLGNRLDEKMQTDGRNGHAVAAAGYGRCIDFVQQHTRSGSDHPTVRLSAMSEQQRDDCKVGLKPAQPDRYGDGTMFVDADVRLPSVAELSDSRASELETAASPRNPLESVVTTGVGAFGGLAVGVAVEGTVLVAWINTKQVTR